MKKIVMFVAIIVCNICGFPASTDTLTLNVEIGNTIKTLSGKDSILVMDSTILSCEKATIWAIKDGITIFSFKNLTDTTNYKVTIHPFKTRSIIDSLTTQLIQIEQHISNQQSSNNRHLYIIGALLLIFCLGIIYAFFKTQSRLKKHDSQQTQRDREFKDKVLTILKENTVNKMDTFRNSIIQEAVKKIKESPNELTNANINTILEQIKKDENIAKIFERIKKDEELTSEDTKHEKEKNSIITSQKRMLYAEAINGLEFYHITENPGDLSVYELELTNSTTATFKVYTGAEKRVINRPGNLEGCETDIVQGGKLLQTINIGRAHETGGKWIVDTALKVKII